MIQVEKYPDRKREMLVERVGNVSHPLASFRNRECVDLFLESINRMFNEAYQQGVAAGQKGKP